MMYSSVLLNGCATSVEPLVKTKLVRIAASEYSANNSWNINPVSGQVNNNNNKYNSNLVRPVAALDDRRIDGWMNAYFACLANKMSSEQCTLYRLHEEDLMELIYECEEHRYVPSTSVCFCVRFPKIREIFAAAFRDRIVQHWIAMRIEPLFEQRFVAQGDVSWNCRKKRGTQKAVLALRRDIMELSENYTKEAWVGRFDIRSFFMSIDIRILERYTVAFVRKYYKGDDLETLVYLLTVTIRHRPQDNCVKHGDLSLWEKLPKHKSLFNVERFRGMPIGNITSQLLANFYLSFLDGYMMGLCEALGARYERFVDDFAVVCRHKGDVLMLRDSADAFLRERLNMEMHHDKQYIQEVRKGVYFVGAVIKMDRVYTANRTVGGFYSTMHDLGCFLRKVGRRRVFTLDDAYALEHYLSSLNSYMGFMVGRDTYAIRRRAVRKCKPFFDYLYVVGRYENFRIRKEYRINNILKEREYYGK